MNTTSLVVCIVIIALGIYDLCMVVFGGVDSSISRFMQYVGLRSPFIALVIGYCLGHWWSPMDRNDKNKNGRDV